MHDRRAPLLVLLLFAALAAPAGASAQGYQVPPDNPFVGRAGAAPEVYAYGLRNPWRFSFDRQGGALLIGDVGQAAFEEIDYRPPGQAAGSNFGWNCFEGFAAYSGAPAGCTAPGHVPPIVEYPNSHSPCAAVTGGYVVRDPAFASSSLLGRYVYGDYCTRELWSVNPTAADPMADVTDLRGDGGGALLSAPHNPGSFGEDASGRIYVATLGGGKVQRLVPGTQPGRARLDDYPSSTTSFNTPVYVASPPGDTNRLFVVEQGGTIAVVRDDVKLQVPFLDITDLTGENGEQGLLSMAFPPDYATSGRFYVDYTDVEPGDPTDVHVDEFVRSASNPDQADRASRRSVLVQEHTEFGNHNGGQLQFGPDGLLYVSIGDGGSSGDPNRNGQNLGTLLGKILRIDPRPSTAPVGGGPGQDRSPPRLITKTGRRQRVLRQRAVVGYGRCLNEACNVAMSGRLRIGRLSYPLIRTVKGAGADKRVKLRMRLTRRAAGVLRRALRRHRRASVLVSYRARDGAGNSSALKRVRVGVRR